ncbi:unnamed protein product [Rhizoctonia solani]|uniref:Tc1-like transposase DDE domain-containing protein n=1 Tax=Rhizoctonia solani TaxID=456999 RepID=A0A8H3BJJ8_9AGAM|nr:unnamed protein product [Rhizoctonia solani]
MPTRTPDTLCATVIRIINEEDDIGKAMRLTGLSPSTVKSIMTIWRTTGTTRSRVPRALVLTGRPRALQLGHIWYVAERLKQSPTLYLDEIRDDLSQVYGVNVSLATVSNTIRRHGITRKKVEKQAKERDEAQRIEFCQIILYLFTPEQLFCVDECSIDERGTVRTYGYAPSGQPVHENAPFDQGIRYSLVPALSLDGILALRIIEGPFKAESFKDFIRMLLTRMNPYPGRNSVIIMDNARIHRQTDVLEMIEEHDMRFLLLPTYSPDLHPIEFAFSKTKTGIERDGEITQMIMSAARDVRPRGAVDYVDPDVLTQLYQHVYSVTADDARGWFRKCHYSEL